MTDRSILMIISGGVAAYKCPETIRQLGRAGVAVRAIMTRAAHHFTTPLTIGAVTGDKVYSEMFDLTDEHEMGHIELSRSADLVVVAPATADLMAKAANGLADDLASTTLLATDKPVLMAPAMNVRMWEHAAVKRNVARLKADGVMFVGPHEGDMACGEFGMGRMAEPEEIVSAVLGFFRKRNDRPLAGLTALITAGPTYEAIDPVRYLGNRSSGKQGYAIAETLAECGADVTLVSGPVALPDPADVKTIRVESARDMLAAVEALGPVDVAVCAAAVADYRPAQAAQHKVKKDQGGMTNIPLQENPDILSHLSQAGTKRPRLVIGFAAETENIVENARAKRLKKKCDWIIANDVSTPKTGAASVMGGEVNKIHLISDDGVEDWPALPKREVAERLAGRIAETLGARARDAAE